VGAVRAAGLQERVAIDGFRADIADLYVAADVVAQPSRSEGLGRAAIEAAAFGRPVVAFDLPGIDETVVDGETGRLVAAGDHAGFADALVALCVDASLRRRLGEGGRRLARDRFDPAAAAARVEAVLLAARRARRDRRAGGPGPRALPEPGDRRPAGVR
jgi:D-inositol-3-phosphate glycosyltransferase